MSYILKLTPKNKLFMGGMSSAQNENYLIENEISMVINCAKEIPNLHGEKYKYHNVGVLDDEKETIMDHFEDCYKFIIENLESQKNILIHCAFGVSRSATVTIFLLMKLGRLTRIEAQGLVEIQRPEISPNLGFLSQLDTYQELQEELSQQLQQTEQPSQQLQLLESIFQLIKQQREKDLQCSYRCRKCGTEQFKSLDILHGSANSCTSVCINQPAWLPADHLQSNDGNLNCKKCSQKLGSYKLSGMKCNCSEWIAPGYQIQKCKLDRKKWDTELNKWC